MAWVENNLKDHHSTPLPWAGLPTTSSLPAAPALIISFPLILTEGLHSCWLWLETQNHTIAIETSGGQYTCAMHREQERNTRRREASHCMQDLSWAPKTCRFTACLCAYCFWSPARIIIMVANKLSSAGLDKVRRILVKCSFLCYFHCDQNG